MNIYVHLYIKIFTFDLKNFYVFTLKKYCVINTGELEVISSTKNLYIYNSQHLNHY